MFVSEHSIAANFYEVALSDDENCNMVHASSAACKPEEHMAPSTLDATREAKQMRSSL